MIRIFIFSLLLLLFHPEIDHAFVKNIRLEATSTFIQRMPTSLKFSTTSQIIQSEYPTNQRESGISLNGAVLADI